MHQHRPSFFVQFLEGGIEAGLERMLAQQSPAEGVNCSDESLVPPRQATLLELLLEPLAEFSSRLPREGDCRDLLSGGAAGDEPEHPVHQPPGLSGTRPRLNQEIGVEVLLDAVAIRLVGWGQLLHDSPPRRAIMSRYCSSDSPCSPAHAARGDEVLRPSVEARHTGA